MLSAIIVAGGGSQRMGFDKTFALLQGEPVIFHSIAAFERAACVDAIVVVGRADCLTNLRALTKEKNFRKIAAIVAGGTRRQDSVQAGLAKFAPATDFVAVHDAARPLVRPETIERVFEAAAAGGGASCAAPVVDTLKRVDAHGAVIGGVDRQNLFAVQTPQIFRRALLQEAYAAVAQASIEITDEISALEQIGGKVVLVPNDAPNFKLTFPADLALAEMILRGR